MEILVKRIFKGEDYAIGKMYVDGKYFCDTLEDKVRNMPAEPKVYGKTAIPTGTYKVVLMRSPRFDRILPRLLAVPYFEGILIHAGNSAADSSGCILLGENREKGKVLNSRVYENKLVKMLKSQTDIKITIV